jgi:2-oxo-3-hexenedioate decarboxylase/2-keto-4-pentenoate hydratase
VIPDRLAEAAAVVAARRLAHTRLDALPPDIAPRDEGEAYRVQEVVHERLTAGGHGPRIGYKVACTTRVMQDYLGIPSPCFAGLFAAGRHDRRAVLDAGGYARIGAECEIAVLIGRDLPPAAAPFTRDTVAPAVAAAMPAIEVVDDRYVDWRTTPAPTLIADDFFSAGSVLGEPVSPAVLADPARLVGTTVINGVEAGRGTGADVLGHPLNALVWLADHLAARGRTLREGEIVLLGSLVETKWLGRGDTAVVSITGLGAVELAVV